MRILFAFSKRGEKSAFGQAEDVKKVEKSLAENELKEYDDVRMLVLRVILAFIRALGV